MTSRTRKHRPTRPTKRPAGRPVASRRSTREADALMWVARLLNERLGVVTVCQRIVEYVSSLLPIRFAGIGLLDPSGNLHVVARTGDPSMAGGPFVVPRGVGVTGRAVQQGRPFWCGDVWSDKRFLWPDQVRERLIAGGRRAVLAVPLRTRGRTVGALTVADRNAREFTSAEIRLVRAFGDQAATAIENAQLHEAAERHRCEAEQLAQVARTLTAAVGASAVATQVAETLVSTFGARAAGVTRLESDGALVVLSAVGAVRPLPPPGARIAPGAGVLEMAVREGRPCWSPDILNDPRIVLTEERRQFTIATGLRSVLAVSLVVGGRAIGTLSLGFEAGRSVSEREIAIVQALADLAAIALDKASLYDEAQRRRQEAEILADITQKINGSLDRDTVLERVAEGARNLCGSDLAGIALREPGASRAVFRCAPGALQDWRGVEIVAGQGAGGAVLLTGQPFKTDDRGADQRISREYDDLCAAEGIVAQAVVPIRRNGEIQGLLYVSNRSARSLTDRDVEIVTRLAESAAIAIHNAQLFTERSQALAALQQSERQYRLLAENVTDVVMLIDMDMRQTYVSPSIVNLRGYTPDEAMTHSLGERMTPASAELVTRTLREELAIQDSACAGPGRIRTLELELCRKDGSTVWVETTATYLRDEAGRPAGIIAVSRDITDRKRAEAALRENEAQLRHAQKIEAIGRLAGGIAHDFNNVLTIVTARTEHVLRRLAIDDAARRDLEIIKATTERIGLLTKQLLAFSRRQVLQPRVLDLNSIVVGVAQMLQRLIGEDVDLVTRLASDLGAVHADPTQIEQIIFNLVVNGRDAMPKGGRLVIETANVLLDDAFVTAHPGSAPGAHVLLEVSDTGTGMTPEIQAQIFEPFFTTKKPGRGTGLGLATVYGIVKQHEGSITVESAPGAGATFRIYLKRFEGPARPA